MSSWKECPNLFANGKFEFKYMNTTQTLHGYYKSSCLAWGIIAYAIEDCKLIARPIPDMSDEEIASWEKVKHPIEYDYGNDSALIESPKSFMYLIEIGVLPREFDDTDVIWRYENE